MNRRAFAKSIIQSTASAIAASGFPSAALSAPQSTAAATIPFRFSVMLWTVFRDLPFDQRLEKVAEAGIKNVELTGEFSKWSDDDFVKFNAKRRSLGMTFDASSGIRTGIGDPASSDRFLAEFQQMLVTMNRIECPTIIVLSGNRVDAGHDAQHAACIDNLLRASDLAAKQNVSVILENIDPVENPRYYLTSVAEGFEIVRKVNRPNVKLLYDFYHEQIAEGNLIDKLQKNIDFTAVVHVADVPGRHEPGTGEINYPNIFRTLAQLNFTGTVAMEFLPTGEPVAALRTARELALRSAATP